LFFVERELVRARREGVDWSRSYLEVGLGGLNFNAKKGGGLWFVLFLNC